jgi:hypothetical protein
MKQRSLNASGTPWSGPRHRPRPASSWRRRRGQRAIGVHRDEGAQAIVELRDPIEVVARDLDRGDLARRIDAATAARAREVGQRRAGLAGD